MGKCWETESSEVKTYLKETIELKLDKESKFKVIKYDLRRTSSFKNSKDSMDNRRKETSITSTKNNKESKTKILNYYYGRSSSLGYYTLSVGSGRKSKAKERKSKSCYLGWIATREYSSPKLSICWEMN